MEKHSEQIYAGVSAHRDFLLNKVQVSTSSRQTPQALADAWQVLQGGFAHLAFTGDRQEPAWESLQDAVQFAALLVKADPPEETGSSGPINDLVPGLKELGGPVDEMCKLFGGIWGIMAPDKVACLLDGKNALEAGELGRQLQSRFLEEGRSVSVGIATYPTLEYKREEILGNAAKALDHASFFGPGSRVAFDAVSLNISGDKLYQADDITGAIAEYEIALRLDPSSINVHNSLGVCLAVTGSLEAALKEFETALSLDSQETMALYNAGLVQFLLENHPQALDCFLKAEARDPDLFELAYQTGRLYFAMGDLERGEQYLERAAQLRPDPGPVHRILGENLQACGQIEKAVLAYKRAVKCNPEDAASLSALGYLFEIKGENLEIASLFCRHSVELDPRNGLFRHRLGRLLLKQAELKKALNEFKIAEKLGCDSQSFIESIEAHLLAKAS